VQVVDQRKQAVSIRLGGNDLRNIKRLSKRIGVRDSDVIRYAVKTALRRLSPLCDEAIRGRNLVPVLVEAGEELIRHFELDSYRLDSIVNAQTDPALRVERDDIALIAMSSMREEYMLMRVKDGWAVPTEPGGVDRSLRHYLYEKYILRSEETRLAEERRRAEEARVVGTTHADEINGRVTQRPAA
jgi:hypothetical protein